MLFTLFWDALLHLAYLAYITITKRTLFVSSEDALLRLRERYIVVYIVKNHRESEGGREG
jgi:hypothetical protein